jgi:integrase/recombinase XerD
MIDDLRLRNRSPRTIEAYVSWVAKLARFHRRSPDQVGAEEVRAFLLHLLEQKVAWSTYNQAINALRFFYGVTLGQVSMVPKLPHGKQPKAFPSVLSRDEVVQLLAAVRQPRYRLMLRLTYGCGLRLSEVLHLKVADIDSRRMVLHVRQGKGQKDRLVPLSVRLLEELRTYWRQERPADWLFPGKGARPLCAASLQRMCQRAVKHCGLRKKVSVHTLRHSYATHLLEAGVDLGTLQRLLGHRDLKTTVRYTHLSVQRMQQTAGLLDLIAAPAELPPTSPTNAADPTNPEPATTLEAASRAEIAEISARLERVRARLGR